MTRGAIFGSCSRLGASNEDHVGAGGAIDFRALQRALEALDGDGVGARDQEKVSRRPARRLAALILPTISSIGTTCLPARWPQRFGMT